MRNVRSLCPDIWILAPGVGAQGGDLDDVIRAAIRDDGKGIVVPISRGILVLKILVLPPSNTRIKSMLLLNVFLLNVLLLPRPLSLSLKSNSSKLPLVLRFFVLANSS